MPALIAALPKQVKAEIAALDLAPRDLSRLHARLFLFHGRDDRIIPWTESAILARKVPNSRLILLDNLSHADLKPGGAADTYGLWLGVAALLKERDRVGEQRP